jgi:uncharacterized membrane protein YphA (DoxX/SURF4 family)
MTNGVLLAGRVLMAACFLPPAIAHLSNISGFAATLSAKGLPYANVVSALVVLAELFGPLALIGGFAPRLSGSILVAATAVTTLAQHRFWEFTGAARHAEQAIFMANLGIAAGLMFYLVSGPGALSWQSWWSGEARSRKPAARKKVSRPRSSKPRPAQAKPAPAEDEFAEAA